MKRRRLKPGIPRTGARHAPRQPPSRARRGPARPRPQLAWWLSVIVGMAALFGFLVYLRESPTPGAAAARRPPSALDSAAKPTPDVAPDLTELINRATDLLRQGKTIESLPLLTEALESNPDDEDVHYNLGIVLSRLGRHEEALKHYHEAIRLFPDYVEAHNNLGNSLRQLGRLDEAIDRFKTAVNIMPDFAIGWNNLGTAARQLGQLDEAAQYFGKAIEINPEYLEAHYNLGSCALAQGQPGLALAHFQSVLRLQPDFQPALDMVSQLETNPPPPAAP